MKNFSKFLLLSAVMALAFATVPTVEVKAQSGQLLTLTTGTYDRDTIGASETGLIKYPASKSLATEYSSVMIGAIVLKISGTPTGTVSLEGSPNATDWFPAGDTVYTVQNIAGDQPMPFNAYKKGKWRYYRVKVVASSGTQSYSLRGYQWAYP